MLRPCSVYERRSALELIRIPPPRGARRTSQEAKELDTLDAKALGYSEFRARAL